MPDTRCTRITSGEASKNKRGRSKSVDMGNVNSNRAEAIRSELPSTSDGKNKTAKKLKSIVKTVKQSKNQSMEVDDQVFDCNMVQFEEDGQVIDMMARDDSQFDSDNEDGEVDSLSEGDDSIVEDNTRSEYSTKESDAEGSSDSNVSDDTGSQTTDSRDQMPVKRKQRRHNKRKSYDAMEDKIDKLSNSVLKMQEMLMKKGVLDTNDGKKSNSKGSENKKRNKKKDNTGEDNSQMDVVDRNENESDMTIYHNILEKATKTGNDDIIVDKEISFKRSKLHDSTSSDEQIDTSDDLIDVDINQQFIADCAAAAAIKTKPGGGQSSQDENEECDHN